MSLLLLFTGTMGIRSGISRLGGILIQEEKPEEIFNDDDEVIAIIKKIFLSGILDEAN